jgi:predicted RNase H-like HicB family nuclease
MRKAHRAGGASVPDLPGCIAVGETLEEVEKEIRTAMKLHLDSMREDGDEIPEPTTQAAMVSVAA